jgi:3-oxoacyl-[acyl-carrier-protein] synthase-1
MPPLLSLKPYLGHTLGASGIAELVTLLACLTQDQIPATARLQKSRSRNCAVSDGRPQQCPHSTGRMLNLIGFGGGLASMIIERRT